MCGIAAFFSSAPDPNIRQSFTKAVRLVAHRGPDGEGIQWGRGPKVLPQQTNEAPDWGLGHVRLAILDLRKAGAQPMSLEDDRLWITYNGEIYNYLELREELEQLGRRFRTGTDTGVLLAAYAEWNDLPSGDLFFRLASLAMWIDRFRVEV